MAAKPRLLSFDEEQYLLANSAYYIGVGALSLQYQQNTVSLDNAFPVTLAPTQPSADAVAAHGVGATITCTINGVLTPTAIGSVPATLTILVNVTVAGLPVALSGTGPGHSGNCALSS